MLKFSVVELVNLYFPQITRINTDEYVKKPVNICEICENLLMFLEKFPFPDPKGWKISQHSLRLPFRDGKLILMNFLTRLLNINS